MKVAISILICLIFVLMVFLAAGFFLSAYLGYTFELISPSAFAVGIAVLSLCALVLSIKHPLESKVIPVFLSLFPPLCFLNAVLYILKCRSILVTVSVFVSAGCCCFLAMKYGKPMILKMISLALTALMILPIGYASLFALTFGSVAQNTVVKIVPSPSGKYCAQVIDSDQGAMGGDTIVEVSEQKEINAILFRMKKDPRRVYSGEWGEYRSMDIYWKNDACLVINSVEHPIE